MHRLIATTAALVAAAALVSPSVSAQRATKRVFVQVVDEHQKPVTNLTQADFEIEEERQQREVTRLIPGTAPMRIVLLVDSSTSTQPMMTMFRNALVEFAEAVGPQHEIAFITSGSQIRVRTEPSTDREK